MIKEKNLVPGRMLLQSSERRVPIFDQDGRHKYDVWNTVWHPCMVVAYYPDIKRRHSKKTAPIEGWEVLVLWTGEVRRPIEHVRIRPNDTSWKPAPW